MVRIIVLYYTLRNIVIAVTIKINQYRWLGIQTNDLLPLIQLCNRNQKKKRSLMKVEDEDIVVIFTANIWNQKEDVKEI